MSDARPLVRTARTTDAGGICTIYAPVVASTAISFELVPPTHAEVAERIDAANAAHAWLVAETDGAIVGYAYATSHRARAAYGYSVETSVYVHPDAHGRGIGSLLYAALFRELAARGFYHAYAGITLPNAASIALHKRTGFRRIGTFPRVGFKFGRWHDVSWWYRLLQPGAPNEDAGPARRGRSRPGGRSHRGAPGRSGKAAR